MPLGDPRESPGSGLAENIVVVAGVRRDDGSK
jgi:hypothetical protein